MLNDHDVREVIGSTAYSSDDQKIGKVGQVFLDDRSGRPEFVTVNTGFFGSSESFIPVSDATFTDDRLTVPYTKDKVKEAPQIDLDGDHLDEAEEQRLYQHYSMSHDSSTQESDAGVGDTSRSDRSQETEGHDTSGPSTDDAMTRSEEHLHVGTTSQEVGRARLRKYVTTEEETVTVPVRKERAVLETEPVTDANIGDATARPEISEEEHEVVLNEERVVVEKTTEPVERVRLGTETVTDEETVTEQVRKEHIEADGDVRR